MSMPHTLLNKKFSEESVGLCEEMSLQPISDTNLARFLLSSTSHAKLVISDTYGMLSE